MSKRIAIPEKSEELAELLADDKRREEIFGKGGDPEATKEFLASYVRATNKAGEVAKLVSAEVTAELPKILKGFGVDRPDLTPKNLPANVKGHCSRAIGAQFDGLFESPADYFAATWFKKPDRDADERVRKIRAYSSNVPSEGGFLIPETLRAEILRVALETSIVRSRARIVPMEALTVPYPTIDSSTNAGSVYGGVVCGFTAEGEALAASEATFGRLLLTCKKLTAYTEVPNELLSDSLLSFEAFITTMLPEAIAFKEDERFLNGTGVGEPEGMLLSKALIAVPRDTVGRIKWIDVITMFSRCLPASLARAVWLCSIDGLIQLAQMSQEVGLGGGAVWLNNGVAGPPASILGRPVILTEKVPSLGNQSDISLMDCGYYLIGDRMAMTQASSPHYRFANDITAYRVIERIDGRGWLSSDITPANGGPTLSPFVTLTDP